MKLIKKSLTNNLIKLKIIGKNNHYIIENNNYKISFEKKKSKVLPRSFIRKSLFGAFLTTGDLKYPLTIILFNKIKDLNLYYNKIQKEEYFTPILIKENFLIYKNDTFLIIKKQKLLQNFQILKTLIFEITLLLFFFNYIIKKV
jgi:hypothetical protein